MESWLSFWIPKKKCLFHSGQRSEGQWADCHWHPRDRPGLVLQAEVHWPQEDQGVCSGRGWRDDSNSRPPRPEHPHPEVGTGPGGTSKASSCIFGFFALLYAAVFVWWAISSTALSILPAWDEKGDLGPSLSPAPHLVCSSLLRMLCIPLSLWGCSPSRLWRLGLCSFWQNVWSCAKCLGLHLQDAAQKLPDAALLCHLWRFSVEVCPEGGSRPQHHQT